MKRPDALQQICFLVEHCDCYVISYWDDCDTPSSPNEYLNNLEARLESVHASLLRATKLASERMKTRYDSGSKSAIILRRETKFDV
ncbi:hypothetical protein AVEN_82657-1 [Araneus ventricosus]|uniref:Uncharacterized protein n=1 Tax=Araneus ventricosus TaxID=182803 RepID=A0A4Y2W2T1_ARAVE|nr:hypothetical protein AVEN_82657-1 [Araneus ventricosus]